MAPSPQSNPAPPSIFHMIRRSSCLMTSCPHDSKLIFSLRSDPNNRYGAIYTTYILVGVPPELWGTSLRGSMDCGAISVADRPIQREGQVRKDGSRT